MTERDPVSEGLLAFACVFTALTLFVCPRMFFLFLLPQPMTLAVA